MLSRRWIRRIASAKSGATDHLDPGAQRLGLRLDRVGDEQALDRAGLEASRGAGCEDGVGDRRDDAAGTATAQLLGRLDQGRAGHGEVVDQDRVAAGHVADKARALDALVVAGAGLGGDGHRRVQAVGEDPRLLGEARIGRDDDRPIGQAAAERRAQPVHGVEVVHRRAEEPLDLGRVEIHRDDAVRAGALDRVGADPGADRDARLVLLVALAVGEVRDDGGHRLRARPLQGVDPEQQLHEVVVGRKDGRLHEVDAPPAHVLEHAHEQRPLGEAQHLAAPGLDPEVAADGGRQARAGRAGEDERLVLGRGGRPAPSPREPAPPRHLAQV